MHYQKIIVALSETNRLMEEIDLVSCGKIEIENISSIAGIESVEFSIFLACIT